MDTTKKLKLSGLLTSLAGVVVALIGVLKLREARSMLKTLWHGSSIYGYSSNTLSGESAWLGEITNSKVIIAIGAILIVVGVILLLYSISKSNGSVYEPKIYHKPTENVSEQTNLDRLSELKSLLDKGLITPEEYKIKRKSILDKI